MKNLFSLLTFVVLFSSCSFAQPTPYQQAIGKALTKLGTAETSEDLQTASNQFQRIANTAPKEWLPYYYQSLALARMSFRDRENGDQLADEAQRILDKTKPLATSPKDQSEIKALQGMVYTAKLVVDPMSRGQLYSALSGKEYQEALQLDATNPRAKLMSLQGKMGAAQFFKQDLTPYLTEAKELLSVWDDFAPASKLHPNWGKEMLEEMVTSKKGPSPKNTEAQNDHTPNPATEVETKPATQTTSEKAGHQVSVTIKGLRNSEGQVLVTILDGSEKTIDRKKLSIQNHEATFSLDGLTSGSYAIKYIHDENNDGKLNSGFMGIPKEGYGFSNDARGSMGPPKFEKMTFSVSEDALLTLNTKYH